MLELRDLMKRQKKNKTFFRRMIFLGFETESLPGVVYKKYELSIKEGSPLRRDVEKIFREQLSPDWIKRFNVKELIGKYCEIVCLKDRSPSRLGVYKVNQVNQISIDIKLENLFKPKTPFYLLVASSADEDLVNSLPARIQDQIKSSPEFIASQNELDEY